METDPTDRSFQEQLQHTLSLLYTPLRKGKRLLKRILISRNNSVETEIEAPSPLESSLCYLLSQILDVPQKSTTEQESLLLGPSTIEDTPRTLKHRQFYSCKQVKQGHPLDRLADVIIYRVLYVVLLYEKGAI